mmetsp:Transcript_72815/g.236552  ORF Transcript_72815/g.236552 Transcript_72815/m.236552 type:complete len:204 (+) Transcript_72815:348-959(+)
MQMPQPRARQRYRGSRRTSGQTASCKQTWSRCCRCRWCPRSTSRPLVSRRTTRRRQSHKPHHPTRATLLLPPRRGGSDPHQAMQNPPPHSPGSPPLAFCQQPGANAASSAPIAASAQAPGLGCFRGERWPTAAVARLQAVGVRAPPRRPAAAGPCGCLGSWRSKAGPPAAAAACPTIWRRSRACAGPPLGGRRRRYNPRPPSK